MNTQSKSLAPIHFFIVLLASMLLSSGPASAARIGYYDLELGQGDASQVAPIVTAGHTPVQMFTLTAEELATVDVLFAVNPSNTEYGAEYVAALPAIRTAVGNGLVLILADRRVTEASSHIPHNSKKISFVRDDPPTPSPANGDINIADNGTLVTNGPGGTLNDESLDGGVRSNHGYALTTTLPGGSKVILVRTAANEAVTFSYPFGLGAVVYAPIPLDAYLSEPERNPVAFRTTYAPNLLAYAAALGGESSALSPIFLRFCHSAGHAGDAACTRVENGQTVKTTGQVASQDLPETGCAPDQPTKGTASASVTPGDYVTVSWTDLNCGNNAGSQSVRVNPIITDKVGTDVKLIADAPGHAAVRLRVVPREAEFDDFCEEEERPRRPQRIVVETLYDGKKLEKWAINGDERIELRLANAVPDDVITSAVVKFWVGRRVTGAKTIIARAFRNGEQVGRPVRRELLAVPRTTFAELQVYTPANFGNVAFDRIEFRAALGSWFGLGSADLQTTRPASP